MLNVVKIPLLNFCLDQGCSEKTDVLASKIWHNTVTHIGCSTKIEGIDSVHNCTLEDFTLYYAYTYKMTYNWIEANKKVVAIEVELKRW